MAIQYVGFATSATSAITPPAGILVGDLMVIYAVNSTSNTAITTAAGWANIGTSSNASTYRSFNTKTATASETASTWTNATDLGMVVYRGMTSKTLTSGATSLGFSTDNVTSTSITVAVPLSQWFKPPSSNTKNWFSLILFHKTATDVNKDLSGFVHRSDNASPQMGVWDTNGGKNAFDSVTWAFNASGFLTYLLFEVGSSGQSVENYRSVGAPDGISVGERIR